MIQPYLIEKTEFYITPIIAAAHDQNSYQSKSLTYSKEQRSQLNCVNPIDTAELATVKSGRIFVRISRVTDIIFDYQYCSAEIESLADKPEL